MREIVIDCLNVNSEREFWNLYLKVVKPDGEEYFGCNLDALWDALSAGGPGFPGEDVESILLFNCKTLKFINGGRLYLGLLSISNDLKKEIGLSFKLVVDG